jgi:hypothetical protein
MNDTINWADKMNRIGAYKKKQLKIWHKKITLVQRIKMTEELLLMNDITGNHSIDSPIHCALSRLLEKRNTNSTNRYK